MPIMMRSLVSRLVSGTFFNPWAFLVSSRLASPSSKSGFSSELPCGGNEFAHIGSKRKRCTSCDPSTRGLPAQVRPWLESGCSDSPTLSLASTLSSDRNRSSQSDDLWEWRDLVLWHHPVVSALDCLCGAMAHQLLECESLL